MKKSTYRIFKAIGIFVTLVLVGSVVFLFYKSNQVTDQTRAQHQESGETSPELLAQNPIGFRYKNEEIV